MRQEPVKIGAVDVEAFAQNLARLVEEGGKALAAYLRPARRAVRRRIRRRDHRRGQDARPRSPSIGWPTRSARPSCSRASARPISICGRRRSNAWRAKKPDPVAEPDPQGPALCRSRMVDQPVLRFSQAGLPGQHPLGRPSRQGRRRARSAHAPEGGVLRPADRQCDRALELRADESGAVARDARLQRRQSRARHAHAGRGHRGRRRQSENPPVRSQQCSRSAATSRSRPAR